MPMAPVGAAPDSVLIKAARGGDLLAWETLVRRHQGFAFRCSYLTARDAAVAEEATRLAFVRAYRALPSLDDESGFRPWLMRIVAAVSRAKKREASQQRDARYVEPQHTLRLPPEPFVPTFALTQPSSLEEEALTAAFDRLGDDDREIVASRYALGLSRSEIVAYLGISEGDLDDKLSAALGRLRTHLAGV